MLPAIRPQARSCITPTTGKWTVTGRMSDARRAFTATLLPNGEVLVAGGDGGLGACLAAAELYSPSTGEWAPAGSMTQPRYAHSAALLPRGEVLVAGGGRRTPSRPILWP